jgi:signal transduction histidine kinase/ActR/RegA family two-component response regulator
MDQSEELREVLLNLEEARKREAVQRRTAEALLSGLRVLVMSEDPYEMFARLFEVMKEPLEYDAAFVLMGNEDESFSPLTSSEEAFFGTIWSPGAMLQRVLGGQPVAVFDTHLVEEWKAQPDRVKRSVRSALHFSIHTPEKKAIFVCTHPVRAHFCKEHVILARRFSVLATQAVQNMESMEKLTDLERRLDAEARMAELNRRLIESEKKLARARKMEAIGALAGGVAHDLNNILSGVVSYPDLLLMGGDLSPNQRNVIENIREAGFRAVAVVEDLLTMARGVASARERVNVNQVIHEYLHSPEHQRLVQVHPGIVVEQALDKELFHIRASRIHVTKALMNLVSNAVEAVQGRIGGLVTIKTENRYIDRPLKGYSDVEVGEYAVLTVEDNGPGISGHEPDQIFEPFYTKKVMGRSGTGLGLTVVWNVMQDHDGYVDVSTRESGARFRLYFPITREAPREEMTPRTGQEYIANGETVLVIDDMEDQRKIACAMLAKLGYAPHAVSSGEEALEYLKDRKVDILLLDMIMDPGMNGLETYRRIIEIHPGAKAVIASGYSLSKDVVAAQDLGAGVFIRKPYTLAKLGAALKEMLLDT